MTEITLDQNDEEVFSYEVSDEALEVAAGKEKANHSVGLYCLLYLPWPLTSGPTILARG